MVQQIELKRLQRREKREKRLHLAVLISPRRAKTEQDKNAQ
ncbi:MAG: hypothetical protein OXF06_10575 [Bacteroidetes bacterium]|nr:hypothetical protein [Bacteroidota bacterium]